MLLVKVAPAISLTDGERRIGLLVMATDCACGIAAIGRCGWCGDACCASHIDSSTWLCVNEIKEIKERRQLLDDALHQAAARAIVKHRFDSEPKTPLDVAGSVVNALLLVDFKSGYESIDGLAIDGQGSYYTVTSSGTTIKVGRFSNKHRTVACIRSAKPGTAHRMFGTIALCSSCHIAQPKGTCWLTGEHVEDCVSTAATYAHVTAKQLAQELPATLFDPPKRPRAV